MTSKISGREGYKALQKMDDVEVESIIGSFEDLKSTVEQTAMRAIERDVGDALRAKFGDDVDVGGHDGLFERTFCLLKDRFCITIRIKIGFKWRRNSAEIPVEI